MSNKGWRALVSTAGFAALSVLATAAEAGLVRGNWDPAFGTFLPNLSYQIQAEFLVPNACSNLPNGTYSTTTQAECVGTQVQGVWLRLFDANFASPDPSSFFTIDVDYSTYGAFCSSAISSDPRCAFASLDSYQATSVRIQAGQVVAFDTNTNGVVTFYSPNNSSPLAAEGNTFDLHFTTSGPVVDCGSCRASLSDPFPSEPNHIIANTADLVQFLVTYTDDAGETPKFTDPNGNALGARLDGSGTYLGQSTSIDGPVLPEPGSLALLLGALGAGWVARRRVATA